MINFIYLIIFIYLYSTFLSNLYFYLSQGGLQKVNQHNQQDRIANKSNLDCRSLEARAADRRVSRPILNRPKSTGGLSKPV